MPRVRVTGTEQLRRVADVLADHADGKSLRRKMARNIRAETEVITAEQRASVAAGLPKRGGLAGSVAGVGTFSTRISTGKNVAVTIVDSWRGHSMRGIDSGLIRHPLFGNRDRWFTTKAPEGLLTKPFRRHEFGIRRAVISAIDETAREIAKETK